MASEANTDSNDAPLIDLNEASIKKLIARAKRRGGAEPSREDRRQIDRRVGTERRRFQQPGSPEQRLTGDRRRGSRRGGLVARLTRYAG